MKQGHSALFFYLYRKRVILTVNRRMDMSEKKWRLEEGMTETMTLTVSERQTAQYLGSGKSEILATPALVALMEIASQRIVERGIPPDCESVGTGIELGHDAMTPIGAEIEIRAILRRIDGKELFFELSASDASGTIAKGVHKRVVTRTAILKRLLKRKG